MKSPQNEITFFDLLKKFGSSQNIIGPVEKQGTLKSNFGSFWGPDIMSIYKIVNNYNSFLGLCLFLAKNLINFDPPKKPIT